MSKPSEAELPTANASTSSSTSSENAIPPPPNAVVSGDASSSTVTAPSESSASSASSATRADVVRVAKHRVALHFGYNGAGYYGLQVNPGYPTIEQDLENAIHKAGFESLEDVTIITITYYYYYYSVLFPSIFSWWFGFIMFS